MKCKSLISWINGENEDIIEIIVKIEECISVYVFVTRILSTVNYVWCTTLYTLNKKWIKFLYIFPSLPDNENFRLFQWTESQFEINE